MSSFRFRPLLVLALSVTILSSLVVPIAASSAAAEASPSAKADLICHTDNPAECYPKIFSATEEFQIVHDDQDLPSGLHVRMDIWSGKKEARLNTPMPDDPSLEGLPVEQSVLVLEPPEGDQDAPPIRSGAPAYDPVGVVKEPQVQDPDFAAALDFLRQNAETAPPTKHPLDDALVDLEDISHDMYYGKEIVQDAEVVKSLFCLLTQRDAQVTDRPLSERRDFLASSILSSSLQNNPPALKNLENIWDAVMSHQCSFHHQKSLKDVFFPGLRPNTEGNPEALAHEPTWIRTTLPVVGRLLKNDHLKTQFINHNGMENFLGILLTEGEEWEAARVRVARIVSDTYLDENVGASLRTWPMQHANDAPICEQESTRLNEGCWEYHLDRIVQKTGSEWAQELLVAMKSARVQTGRVKDEL